MQTNCIQYSDSKIREFFGRYKANSLAKKVGASKRKNRKFSVIDIILSYWQLQSIGEFSYDKWAIQLSLLINKSISGQALWKRLGPEMVELLKELLHKSFKQKYNTFINSAVFEYFPNVYIQDATHFSLPRSMSCVFPGSYSKYGKSATAKVQAIFNIRSGIFSCFKLASFRDNDQKDSGRIIGQLQEKDLVIRDLGYFVLNVFSEVNRKNAFFLSRLKYGVNVFDTQTNKVINLYKVLKMENGVIDMQVKLGQKEKLACRLVAVPVPGQVANERKRKAKSDRNKKSNHKKEYLDSLGYTIYIMNVPQEIWDVKQVERAYRGRWYIEILFKGWKSSLKMKNNIPQRYINQNRVEFFFYSSLLMVNVLVLPTFLATFKNAIGENKYMSILKLCAFISSNIMEFFHHSNYNKLLKYMKYSCQYESRTDRINSIEFLLNIDP